MRKAVLVACSLACLFAPAVGASEPGPRVVIALRNYAGVPRETLDLAEAQVSKIFEKAGLTIEWSELPVPDSAIGDLPSVTPATLVKIFRESRIASLRRSSGALGCALGTQVYIFADHIRQATEGAQISFPIALGHIMAHEIGHVLLGENSHAPKSIMSPRLGAQEFQRMEMGSLLFSKAQANRMHERLLAQQAAETAVLLAQK